MLMPGVRFKPWPVYAVQKFPWVQVPGGEIDDSASPELAAIRREIANQRAG